MTSVTPHSPTAMSGRVKRADPAQKALLKAKLEEEKQTAAQLYSHSGVNKLLLAEPGKLTLKEMHGAVLDHQAKTKAQESQVSELTNSLKGTRGQYQRPHIMDYSIEPDVDDQFPGDSRHMQEMIYLRSCALYSQHERSLEINPTKHRIGHVLMAEQQRFDLEEDREHKKAVNKARIREQERAQSSNVLNSDRVISVVNEDSIVQPKFIVDAAEVWPSRKRMLGNFLASVTKFIVRRRVDDRLAAVKTHMLAEKKKQLAAGANSKSSPDSAHPLSADSITDPEQYLQRDFQLYVNNVQNVGHVRGHDNVTRDEVDLETVNRPKEMVTFDDVIPFDAAVLNYPANVPTPVVPTFMPYDWLNGLRTGAWEESWLRAPRGELETEEKKSVDGASTAADTHTITLHAHVNRPTQELTSPAHTSTALLDVEAQTSVPIQGKAAAKPAKDAKAATTAAPASTVTAPSTITPHPPLNNTASNIPMPSQFLSFHPIAQQHSLISAPSLCVPSSLDTATETSYAYAFRPSNVVESPDTGYFYNQEFVANGSLRTLDSVPSMQHVWRPRREVTVGSSLLEEFSLPLRVPRRLNRLPKEDDLSDTDDDEYMPNLKFKPQHPTIQQAKTLFDTPSPVSNSANAASAVAGVAPSPSAAASSSPPLAAPAQLDLGLGVPLLSSAIKYPSLLLQAAERAIAAKKAKAEAEQAAADAAAAALAAASPRKGKKDKEKASDAAAGESPVAGDDPKTDRKRRSTRETFPIVSQAQPRPGLQSIVFHASALPSSESGSAELPSAEQLLQMNSGGRVGRQQTITEAFRAVAASSKEAVPAIASTSSSLVSPIPLSISVPFGSTGSAAADALQQVLQWEAVQSTGTMTQQLQQLQRLTKYSQQHLATLTRS